MLILPKGYEAKRKEWAVEEYTGALDKPTLRETGCVTTEVVDKSADLLGTVLKWHLPETFCPDCERKDISPENSDNGSRGTWVFDEPRPDLEMRPGDVLIYYVCGDCRNAETWDDSSRVILPPAYRSKYRRQRRIGMNCVAYIKMLISRGEKPVVEGHSYVR